jgi:hypothetical protein
MGALARVQRREGYCRQYRRFQTSESWSELTRMLLPFCLTQGKLLTALSLSNSTAKNRGGRPLLRQDLYRCKNHVGSSMPRRHRECQRKELKS